jgi:serine/threonine protein kinase/lipoprotein NlpI
MTYRNSGAEPRELADTSQIVIHPEEDYESNSPTSALGFHGRMEKARSDTGTGPSSSHESCFPAPGEQFLHFHLVEELGWGAFGRVYLARQESLANRLVVLKLSTLACGEPQKLARLQHANIVPVYSVHALERIEAICMPYLGRVTLHHVIASAGSGQRPTNGRELLIDLLRNRDEGNASPLPELFESLGRMSLVEACLWLGAQLAAGLGHAHRRGILHRDLKPANVLITSDAVPMLLDFNVSSDAGRHSASERIGGTFPYMAPEHLQAFDGAFAPVDECSDLYSLGVILFQLLTGRLPHPMTAELEAEGKHSLMIEQRQTPPPRPSQFNPAVPPSVDAIVLKLLDPSPPRRYQRADDLHTDLTRQLTNQPLMFVTGGSTWERVRKWRKRNPRLATGLSVAAFSLLALILPAASIAAQQARQTARALEVQKAEATHLQSAAINEMQTAAVMLGSRSDPAMRDQGFALARRILERYGIIDDAEWEARPGFRLLEASQQLELKAGFGELLILMTRVEQARSQSAESADASLRWNTLAGVMFAEGNRPSVIDRQRQEIPSRQPVDLLPAQAVGEPYREIDLYFDGLDLAAAGLSREALALLKRFVHLRPNHFNGWYVRGMSHDALGQSGEAAAAFAVCVSLRPDFPHAYLNRGLAYLKLRRYAEAEADFTRTLELKEHWLLALIYRGIARDNLRKPRDAEADYTAALRDAACPTRVWFLRARSRRALGDQPGFAEDRARGFAATPTDAHSYRTRGMWRMENREFDQAMADFDAALKLHPGDTESLLNKGIVLADHLHREAEAIPQFDRLLGLAPDHVDARCSRGVYHARLGHGAEARRDAEDSLKADSSAYRLFQAAGLYAQLSKVDPKAKDEAVRLLARAMRAGFNNAALLKSDHDLDPIRTYPNFGTLLTAIGQVDGLGR